MTPTPGFQEIYANHVRGGYCWTMAVNQRIGAVIAAAAIRAGISPNQLTLAGVICALATVPIVLLLSSAPVPAGLALFFGMQLAYSLDCADGQVARALHCSTRSGAVLDLICDYVSHVCVAVIVLALPGVSPAGRAGGVTGVLLTAGLTALVFFETLAGGVEGTGELKYRPPGVWLRQGADYGVQTAAVAIAIGTGRPRLVLGTAVAIAFYNVALVCYRLVHLPAEPQG